MYDCMKSLMNSLNAWHIWCYGFVTFRSGISHFVFAHHNCTNHTAESMATTCDSPFCLRKRSPLATVPSARIRICSSSAPYLMSLKPRYLPSSVVQLTTLNLTTSRNRTIPSTTHFIYSHFLLHSSHSIYVALLSFLCDFIAPSIALKQTITRSPTGPHTERREGDTHTHTKLFTQFYII